MKGAITKARSRLWAAPSERIRQIPLPALVIGSFFFVGLSPISSGTVGSAVAAALYYGIPLLQHNWLLVSLCAVCLVVGSVASNVIAWSTHEHDAGIIVIDEVLGQWTALFTLWYAGDLVFVISAFILFRIFDIFKVYPASVFEKRQGGTAVMLDDVVAGVYANIGAHLATYAYYHYFARTL